MNGSVREMDYNAIVYCNKKENKNISRKHMRNVYLLLSFAVNLKWL